MIITIATPDQIKELSKLSVRVGNIPLSQDQCIAATIQHENKDGDIEVVGFAAVQSAWHAAGSWVKEEFRRQNLTYEMRHILDSELRRRGIPVYLAIPGTDFEKALFAKYGHTTEHIVQVRHL